MKKCSCGNIIKKLSARRCRRCYLTNPDRGYSHNYSKEELKRRSISMSEKRKNGKIFTWNKGKDLRKERPEIGLHLQQVLKGKRCNRKGEFKKGHEMTLAKRGDLINRHHIDLNKYNNEIINLLFLTNSKHNQLHKRAYDYLVKTNQVQEYIKWFIKEFKPKLYTYSQYKKINKSISKQLRK